MTGCVQSEYRSMENVREDSIAVTTARCAMSFLTLAFGATGTEGKVLKIVRLRYVSVTVCRHCPNQIHISVGEVKSNFISRPRLLFSTSINNTSLLFTTTHKHPQNHSLINQSNFYQIIPSQWQPFTVSRPDIPSVLHHWPIFLRLLQALLSAFTMLSLYPSIYLPELSSPLSSHSAAFHTRFYNLSVQSLIEGR